MSNFRYFPNLLFIHYYIYMITRKVKSGMKEGRKIGFPTLNLNVGAFSKAYKPGVYVSQVKIFGKSYKGVLYFGPKMTNKGNILEIFVLGFSKHIYGEYISFEVGKKVREPKKLSSLEELKKQIQIDIKSVV